MPKENDPERVAPSPAREAATDTPNNAPLKRELRGMSFAEQVQKLAPDEAAAAKTDHPMLRVGSDGPEVEELQAKLNAAGMADPPLAMDGRFGSKTGAAVIAFQRSRGLGCDGVVGPMTWGALDRVSGSRVFNSAERATIGAQIDAANATRKSGAYGPALAMYTKLYQQPNIPPEFRATPLWGMAYCRQALGDFGVGLELYQEFMMLPQSDAAAKLDAQERIRECRLGQPPGDLASDKPQQPTSAGAEAVLTPIFEAANKAMAAKDFATARPLYQKVYAHPEATPPYRIDCTWNLAACAQGQGEFALALSYYQETLDLPHGDAGLVTDALERMRECREGKAPGTMVTQGGGRAQPTGAREKELQVIWAEADGHMRSKSYGAAKKLYTTLYRELPQEQRPDCTWNLAACDHGLGEFGEAVSLYQEFMHHPGGNHMGVRDALQRIREARAGLMPGMLESNQAQEGKVAAAA